MSRADTSAQILRNKRVVQRSQTTGTTTGLTPDLSESDHYSVTSLQDNLSIGAPIGNPHDGDRLFIRIRDKGLSRLLSWNAIYRGSMPASTTTGKTHVLEFVRNDSENKWDCVIAITL